MGGRNLLRKRQGHEADRVGYAELFFDLVFVFAITQLSHTLLHDLSPAGAGHALMLLMGVWWVWVFTTWCTNWLDPERMSVRLLLFALMAAGLFVSMAIGEAFEGRGLVFAVAFVAMQVGRCLFMLHALAGQNRRSHANFVRITIWLSVSGIFWLLGGLAEPGARTGFWIVALAIEYLGPAAFFRVPGLQRSTIEDWDISGHHIAERCGLFIIIALGESILITGATFAEMAWTALPLAAYAAALVGSIAMWWIYFNIGAERASRRASEAEHAGAIGRLAYTYIHLPIVAGIIVSAAADELAIAHPGGHLAGGAAATLLGGPALFLTGVLLFKRTTGGLWHFSHLVGLLLLGAATLSLGWQTPLSLAAATSAILVLVAIWETLSLRSTEAD